MVISNGSAKKKKKRTPSPQPMRMEGPLPSAWRAPFHAHGGPPSMRMAAPPFHAHGGPSALQVIRLDAETMTRQHPPMLFRERFPHLSIRKSSRARRRARPAGGRSADRPRRRRRAVCRPTRSHSGSGRSGRRFRRQDPPLSFRSKRPRQLAGVAAGSRRRA